MGLVDLLQSILGSLQNSAVLREENQKLKAENESLKKQLSDAEAIASQIAQEMGL